MPLSAVFDGGMAWHESWDLTRELLADPSSHVGAAAAGWAHPTSREAIVMADLFDLTLGLASGRKRPKPYPRPWDEKPKRYGKTDRSPAEVLAILNAHGHGIGAPRRDSRGRIHGPDGRYRKG